MAVKLKDVKTVTPVLPVQVQQIDDPNLVDIRDEEKHLLFKYNALTDSVVIKAHGKLYRIDVGELRFVLKRNVISDAPVTVFDLQPGTAQGEPGTALPDNPQPDTPMPAGVAVGVSGSAFPVDRIT